MTSFSLIDDKLRELGLSGMAEAIEHQSTSSAFDELGFSERLMHLLHAESSWRDARRLKRILSGAKLKVVAAPEQIDFRGDRHLDRAQIAELVTCRWIEAKQNLIITGPTGTGKTWLACAFAVQAARHGLTVRYARTSLLLDDMRLAHQDGSIGRVRAALTRVNLLLLDDFGLVPITELGKQDLLDIVDARTGSGAILFSGQLPMKDWHDYLDSPMIADALLDRIVNNAHRLPLTGESMRRRTKPSVVENVLSKPAATLG